MNLSSNFIFIHIFTHGRRDVSKITESETSSDSYSVDAYYVILLKLKQVAVTEDDY